MQEDTTPRRPLRRTPGLIAAVIYAAVALACTQIPLLNYLGFESSLLFAFVGSLVSGISTALGIHRFLMGTTEGAWSVAAVKNRFKSLLGRQMFLLSIPLVILLLNAFVVRNCSLAEGLAFFALLPVVSVWFSSCLGLFCAVHYRHPRLIFLSLLSLSLLYSVWLGYFTPAIFSYNFFYGYFPGLSYDEVLRLTLPLLLFRAVTVAAGIVLVRCALVIVRETRATDSTSRKGITLLRALISPRTRVASCIIAAAVLLLFVFRCDLGWESTATHIQSTLGSSHRTAHFILYYSGESFSPEEIRRIGAEHEFRLAQLEHDLGKTDLECIESYLYPDNETKRRLIGTGSTNIAKPWSGQIHLSRQGMEDALKHELAHVVAGTFGLPVIRASLSTGLVEGLATAQDGFWGNRTLHTHAAALKKAGMLPDVRSLMSLTGFAVRSTALSYVATGSFCRYLIDAYGVDAVLHIYRTGDYQAALNGRGLSELAAEWERFLSRIRVDERDNEAVDVFFRRPTIFGKTCARVVAGRLARARQAVAEREYARARSHYREAFDDAPGNEAIGGLLLTSVRLGDYAGARRLCDTLVNREGRPARFLPLFLLWGDAAWATGDTAAARRLYERVCRVDLTMELSEAAAVRLAALEQVSDRNDLLQYLLSDSPDSTRESSLRKLAAAHPQQLLYHYLHGRVLARLGRHAEAIAALSSIDLRSMSPALDAARQHSVAVQLYRVGRYDTARDTFWKSLNSLRSEVGVMEAQDWMLRCDWMQRHGS